MADDKNARYRLSDPLEQEPTQDAPASDPLAELARLIGRNDPFAELGRDSARPEPRGAVAGDDNDTAPFFGQEPRRSHYGDSEPYGEAPPRYIGDPDRRFDAAAPRHANDQSWQGGVQSTSRFGVDYPDQVDPEPAPNDGWPGEESLIPGFSSVRPLSPANPIAEPPQPQEPARGESRFEPPRFADLHAPQEAGGYHAGGADHDPLAYPAAPEHPPFPQALYPREPEAGSLPLPPDEEFYDDAPPRDRRKGVLTVAAVLGLAVIGTAGAFGYRSYFGGLKSTSTPPVIRASGEPSKVAPPPAKAETATKFSYDRFGDGGKNEQVVTREEKPVDKVLARSTVPRTILPGGPVADSAAMQPREVRSPMATNAPSALGEPRKVRTVPIRPDQPVPGSIAQSSSATPMPLAPPRQAAVAAATPIAPQADPDPPASRTAPPAAPRAAAPRPPSHSTVARAPVANAPLSLSPDSNNALPPPTPVTPRTSRAASAPTRLASAPSAASRAHAAASSGGYLVQVSSQRSEADAQTSFRNIQSKYSNVLGSRPHVIRRANLGSRGVYYRAMVGPLGTRAQAVALCSSLKAAGGNCIVQSN